MQLDPKEILGTGRKKDLCPHPGLPPHPPHNDIIKDGEEDPEYQQFSTRTEYKYQPMVRGVKNMIKAIKSMAPREFRDAFSRVYKNDTRFEDWRVPYIYTAVALMNTEDGGMYLRDYEAARNNYIFTTRWSNCGRPHFFIEPELFEAVQHTAPPTDFDFDDFKLPDDAILFTVPKNSVMFHDLPISYFGVCKMPEGKNVWQYKNYLPIEASLNGDRFVLTAGTSNGEWFFAPSFAWKDLQRIVSMPADQFVSEADLDFYKSMTHLKNEIPIRIDAAFIQQLLIWGLNLILVMEALPDLVEKGVQIGKMKTRRRNGEQELWSPNVIGRRYRIKRIQEPAVHGSHASPRMHRRRGHHRKCGFGHMTRACLCTHDVKWHGKDAGACLSKDCTCLGYVFSKTTFEHYRVDWRQPVWVNKV